MMSYIYSSLLTTIDQRRAELVHVAFGKIDEGSEDILTLLISKFIWMYIVTNLIVVEHILLFDDDVKLFSFYLGVDRV